MKSLWGAALAVVIVSTGGCSSLPLNTALGTPKNPTPVFNDTTPPPRGQRRGSASDPQVAFIRPLYDTLRNGAENLSVRPEPATMRTYVSAGFALSDIYCSRFFAKTDEAYRRRRFGRAATNDVGTAIATILGLANAGQGVVTGTAAAVGLADSTWRNYDDSFVVSPELSNVQTLVFAAQDLFRARTLGPSATLPGDYATAQSAILRYANLCSYLGMKDLLDQSAGDQRKQLKDTTEEITGTGAAGTRAPAAPATTSAPAPFVPAAPATIVFPATAQPPLATNRAEN